MSAKRKSGKKAIIAVVVVVVAIAGVSLFLKMPGASARAQLQPFMKQPIAHRGLLSKDFIANGEGQSAVNRFALTSMLTNVVARPNFISYELASDGQLTI